MGKKFNNWVLTKVLGWTVDGPLPQDRSTVILGVPHTSIWDFAIAFFYYRSLGEKVHVMIKKEAFFWPFGKLLKAMGGFPMDRKNPTKTTLSLIRAINESEHFHLAICPEGTRKAVSKWKTGYHKIARATGSPVYMGYFNWGTKHIGIGPSVELTDNAREDTARIQALYEQMHLTGKYPDNYTTR